MGIKSINEFLKKMVPDAFTRRYLDIFSGTAIAIDSHIIIHKYFSNCFRDYISSMKNPLDIINKTVILGRTIEEILLFNQELLNNNITPVWIFDGPPGEHKKKCLEDRQEEKNKKINKIEEMREFLTGLNPLLRTKDQISEFKKLLSQNSGLSMKNINEIRDTLKKIGMPVFEAKEDAERMCSALNREGLVSAVWGTDTDNYALGTPILITNLSLFIKDKEDEKGKRTVELVDVEKILDGLNVDLEFLTDLCIMCGCDFNTNMPGYGPKKSYDLLRTYGSFSNIPRDHKGKDLPLDVLNYETCIDAFSYLPSGLSERDIIFDCDMYLIRIDDILEKYKINNKRLIPI